MDLPETEEPEEQEQNRDLRAELFLELSSHFASALNLNESIPVVAREALIGLLDSDTVTSADIITAASKNDPDAEELIDE